MSINFSMPLYYRGTAIPKGKRTPQEMNFIEHVDVSIPVVDPEDAPIAVSWVETDRGAQHQKRSMWVGGKHFFSNSLRPFNDDKSVEKFVRKLLVTRDDRLTARLHYFRLSDYHDRDGDCSVWDPDRFLLIDDRGRNAELRYLSALTDHLCLIGDRLCLKGNDPAYGVSRTQLNRPDPFYSYYLRAAAHNSSYIGARSFSLNDFDAVCDFSPGARRRSGRYEVDVFMPETLTMDHDASALLDVALYVCKTAHIEYSNAGCLARGWSPETREPLFALENLIPQMRNGYTIRDFPSDLDYDQIAIEIENLYPYLWVDMASDRAIRSDLKYVEQIVARWNDRSLVSDPDGFSV